MLLRSRKSRYVLTCTCIELRTSHSMYNKCCEPVLERPFGENDELVRSFADLVLLGEMGCPLHLCSQHSCLHQHMFVEEHKAMLYGVISVDKCRRRRGGMIVCKKV